MEQVVEGEKEVGGAGVNGRRWRSRRNLRKRRKA